MQRNSASGFITPWKCVGMMFFFIVDKMCFFLNGTWRKKTVDKIHIWKSPSYNFSQNGGRMGSLSYSTLPKFNIAPEKLPSQ